MSVSRDIFFKASIVMTHTTHDLCYFFSSPLTLWTLLSFFTYMGQNLNHFREFGQKKTLTLHKLPKET